jgi:hypothetical protein
MIPQHLTERDARLTQAINVKGVTSFHDPPQQKTFSLLEQKEIARSGFYLGDSLFIDLDRVLLDFALQHGPKPGDVYLEEKAAISA